MKQLQSFLLKLILVMFAAVLVASSIKISDVIKRNKEIKEAIARSEEHNKIVQNIEAEVIQLVENGDRDILNDFVVSTMEKVAVLDENLASEHEAEADYFDRTIDYSDDLDMEVYDEVELAFVSDDDISDDSISQNWISGNDISGNWISGNDVSGSDISGGDISGNWISGNDISGNWISGNDISGNLKDNIGIFNVEPEQISGWDYNGSFWGGHFPGGILSLEDKQKEKTSYEETLEVNLEDKTYIEFHHMDLTNLKIVCLGDSITEAINLEKEDHYEELAFPAVLGRCLDVDNIVNLGIGGSAIGRYWADPFVERYKEIPEDADIIIVMGGTNDGFCVSKKEFGHMDMREKGTYIGDLDELMRGLKDDYPEAKVIFATPLPNILHDTLRAEREYLLAQNHFTYAMMALAKEYGFYIVDLYDSNVLDSHDVDVIREFKPDGVHCNIKGYEILGERMATEVLRILWEEQHES